MPAADVTAHVANRESRRRDEHQRAQPLHAVVLAEELYKRNDQDRPEERRNRIGDDDAQLIELHRLPRLAAAPKRVHEPGEASEAHREAGDRQEEPFVKHGARVAGSSGPDVPTATTRTRDSVARARRSRAQGPLSAAMPSHSA